MFKLKHVPTIDFAVYQAPQHMGLFELMLRSRDTGTLQSLHRFRDAQHTEYNLPVLLRPPPDVLLRNGDVVDQSCHVCVSWCGCH